MARRPGDKGGRSSKLTPEIEKTILETIRMGATFAAAADRAGISPDTIQEWRQRGEGTHPKRGPTADLVRFALAVKKAMGDAEVLHVGRITKASEKDWTASAWILERRHPERYGRIDRARAEDRTSVRATMTAPIRLAGVPDDRLEVLLEIVQEAEKPPDSGNEGNSV